jgi:hypothetical protein
MLISIQAKLGLKSKVIDIKGAYLKAIVKGYNNEKLYLRLPDGSIAKLNKYLYGLKQAGSEWNELLSNVLFNNKYNQSDVDPCVFYKHIDKNNYIIMCTHVDDFYVVATSDNLINNLETILKREFGEIVVKSGDIIGYLGMQVYNNKKDGTITLSQPGYVDKILKEVGFNELKISKTPYATIETYIDGDNDIVEVNEYLKLLGLLNYLAVFTRPDILYALSMCAQKCSHPNKGDMRKIMRIFRYIKGTKDKGITFNNDSNLVLQCHVDASYNCYSDGKSHYGLSFSFNNYDGSFYAKSQKLKLVTLSSAETEYVALCEAATEIVFLRNLLDEIGFKQILPTEIFEDNKSAIDMCNGNISHKRSKHINPKYQFTKQLIKHGQIKITYCKSADMIADILTKALNSSAFNYLASKLQNQKTEN